MIRFEITSVTAVQVPEGGRDVTVMVEEKFRGSVMVQMSEDEARWLWASLNGHVQRWREEDGDLT